MPELHAKTACRSGSGCCGTGCWTHLPFHHWMLNMHLNLTYLHIRSCARSKLAFYKLNTNTCSPMQAITLSCNLPPSPENHLHFLVVIVVHHDGPVYIPKVTTDDINIGKAGDILTRWWYQPMVTTAAWSSLMRKIRYDQTVIRKVSSIL